MWLGEIGFEDDGWFYQLYRSKWNILFWDKTTTFPFIYQPMRNLGLCVIYPSVPIAWPCCIIARENGVSILVSLLFVCGMENAWWLNSTTTRSRVSAWVEGRGKGERRQKEAWGRVIKKRREPWLVDWMGNIVTKSDGILVQYYVRWESQRQKVWWWWHDCIFLFIMHKSLSLSSILDCFLLSSR